MDVGQAESNDSAFVGFEVSRSSYADWHKSIAMKKRDFQVDKSPKTEEEFYSNYDPWTGIGIGSIFTVALVFLVVKTSTKWIRTQWQDRKERRDNPDMYEITHHWDGTAQSLINANLSREAYEQLALYCDYIEDPAVVEHIKSVTSTPPPPPRRQSSLLRKMSIWLHIEPRKSVSIEPITEVQVESAESPTMPVATASPPLIDTQTTPKPKKILRPKWKGRTNSTRSVRFKSPVRKVSLPSLPSMQLDAVAEVHSKETGGIEDI